MTAERDPILYIDCTSTIRGKLNTGIQKVVRNIVSLKEQFSEKLLIDCIPICYQFDDFYPADIAETLSEGMSDKSQAIDIRYRDIYLCVDAFWTMDMHSWYPFIKDRGASIATLIYDLIPITHPEHCKPEETALFEAALNTIIDHSELLLCISRSTHDSLVDYCKSRQINLEGKRIAIVPLAPALSHQGSGLASAIQKKRLPQQDFFLAVGTLESRRGYSELLEEFSTYWDSGGTDCLLFIGKTSSTSEKIIEKIENLRTQQRPVLWLSDADDDELLQAYKSAKAVICASHVEGYGMSVAEGLKLNGRVFANRLPVFGEYAGAFPYYFDINTKGELARLVKSADTLATSNQQVFLGSWSDTVEAICNELTRLGLFYGSSSAIELYRNSPNAVRWAYWLYHGRVCSFTEIESWLRFNDVFKMRDALKFEMHNIEKPLTTDFVRLILIANSGRNDFPPEEISYWKKTCKNGKELIERLRQEKNNIDSPLSEEQIRSGYFMMWGRNDCSPDEIRYWLDRKITLGEFRQVLQQESTRLTVPLHEENVRSGYLMLLGRNDCSPDEISYWLDKNITLGEFREILKQEKNNLSLPLNEESIRSGYLMFFGRNDCSRSEIDYWLGREISLAEFRQVLLHEAVQQAKSHGGSHENTAINDL
ncbi:glycosyltransferase [uncultured Pseudomonas sp.]|uniref:glycosyltransferase n=1 Tax=uncultured Pseudomonas sp. TaxID=114707 RepID=UPI0025ECD682|nr:glycosyltransferase [uncultured Pseudomonas sp.]